MSEKQTIARGMTDLDVGSSALLGRLVSVENPGGKRPPRIRERKNNVDDPECGACKVQGDVSRFLVDAPLAPRGKRSEHPITCGEKYDRHETDQRGVRSDSVACPQRR